MSMVASREQTCLGLVPPCVSLSTAGDTSGGAALLASGIRASHPSSLRRMHVVALERLRDWAPKQACPGDRSGSKPLADGVRRLGGSSSPIVGLIEQAEL